MLWIKTDWEPNCPGLNSALSLVSSATVNELLNFSPPSSYKMGTGSITCLPEL